MRRFVPFELLWSMPVEVPYSLLVRDGPDAWSCGQAPLDREGRVRASGDLEDQTRIVCGFIDRLLEEADFGRDGLAKLVLYHDAAEAGDRTAMLEQVTSWFGRLPLVVPVAVPKLFYDGMQIEVDAFATEGAVRTGARERDGCTVRTASGAAQVWALIEMPGDADADLMQTAQNLLGDCLADAGIEAGPPLCEHWYAPEGSSEALVASPFAPPPAMVVLTPGDRIYGELTWGLEPTEIVDAAQPDVALTVRRSGRYIWLSASSPNGGGLVGETESIMKAMAATLADHSLSFADVVKSVTHYVGAGTPEELHANIAVRNARYESPGPASTGIPVAGLAQAGASVAVDLMAIVGG